MYEESGVSVTLICQLCEKNFYKNTPQSQNIFPHNFSKIQDNAKQIHI